MPKLAVGVIEDLDRLRGVYPNPMSRRMRMTLPFQFGMFAPWSLKYRLPDKNLYGNLDFYSRACYNLIQII